MPLRLPETCLRGLSDCEPLAQIQSDNGDSFICCGVNDGARRKMNEDRFTHCWQNSEVQQMDYWSMRDMKDTISVLAQALSVDANIREG